MRHKKKDKKLGRSGSHRKALVASLVRGLIKERRIKTTLPKAKTARSAAEKLVTLARKNTLASRRLVASRLMNDAACAKILVEDIAPQFLGRNGGYTRILKLGRRSSDSSEMALIEWVGISAPDKKKKKKEETPKAAA